MIPWYMEINLKYTGRSEIVRTQQQRKLTAQRRQFNCLDTFVQKLVKSGLTGHCAEGLYGYKRCLRAFDQLGADNGQVQKSIFHELEVVLFREKESHRQLLRPQLITEETTASNHCKELGEAIFHV